MTERQKSYIKFLDDKCKRHGLKIRSTNEDLLGEDWESFYKNITPEYTSEVIGKMHEALGIKKIERTSRKGNKNGKNKKS